MAGGSRCPVANEACILGRTNFWTHEFLDARIFGRTDFWTHEFLDGQIFGRTDFWTHESWMPEPLSGREDRLVARVVGVGGWVAGVCSGKGCQCRQPVSGGSSGGQRRWMAGAGCQCLQLHTNSYHFVVCITLYRYM